MTPVTGDVHLRCRRRASGRRWASGIRYRRRPGAPPSRRLRTSAFTTPPQRLHGGHGREALAQAGQPTARDVTSLTTTDAIDAVVARIVSGREPGRPRRRPTGVALLHRRRPGWRPTASPRSPRGRQAKPSRHEGDPEVSGRSTFAAITRSVAPAEDTGPVGSVWSPPRGTFLRHPRRRRFRRADGRKHRSSSSPPRDPPDRSLARRPVSCRRHPESALQLRARRRHRPPSHHARRFRHARSHRLPGDSARLFLRWKPACGCSPRPRAERDRRHRAADQDAAIRDLVKSAFGHAGQKCSAASLSILGRRSSRRCRLPRRLAAAVRTVRVGPGRSRDDHGPPHRRRPRSPPRPHHLDPGEHWLVEPRPRRDWSPVVARRPREVRANRGSTAPSASVRSSVSSRADDLHHALDISRTRSPYGPHRGSAFARPRRDRHLARRRRGQQPVCQPAHHRCDRPAPASRWLEALQCRRRTQGWCPDVAAAPASVPVDGGRPAAAYRQAWMERFGIESDPSAPWSAGQYSSLPSPAQCRDPRRRGHSRGAEEAAVAAATMPHPPDRGPRP